jgi:hypothetical protein
MVMAGGRGMITSARITALNKAEDGTELPGGAYGWITALRAPAIRKLTAGDCPLQLSLSGQHNLAEITSPDFPGERLIACRNPVLAADRARTHEELLAATEKLLAPVIACVTSGRLTGADPIGVEVGKVISRYKSGKHFGITDTSLAVTRNQDRIDAESALDGFYVLRTPVPATELDAPAVVTAYKNLKHVERDFRHLKADDLNLRPICHHLEERVTAHVLICMLACYLTWHLRQAQAPLTCTDENPGRWHRPVAPATRSARTQAKASPARPARPPLPQLPQPSHPPGHPYPQPGQLRRHHRHCAYAHRTHQRATRSLPAHRRPHTPHPEAATKPPPQQAKPEPTPTIANPARRKLRLYDLGLVATLLQVVSQFGGSRYIPLVPQVSS